MNQNKSKPQKGNRFSISNGYIFFMIPNGCFCHNRQKSLQNNTKDSKKKELLTGVTQAKNNESKPKCFDFIFSQVEVGSHQAAESSTELGLAKIEMAIKIHQQM